MTVFKLEGIEEYLSSTEDIQAEGVEWLEDLILECNRANFREEEQLVPDAIYDRLVDILKKFKPSSAVLKQFWEDEGTEESDYDYLLRSYPMLSIQTAKSWNGPEVNKFYETCKSNDYPDLFFSYKINGHGIRVVFADGKLVKATSRARASAGRDLTRQVEVILRNYDINVPSEWGTVEIRGEVALPVSRLEEAREFNPDIKSAFTAVSSLIKPASTPEENFLLKFYAYGLLFEGRENLLSTKEEEYSQLIEMGFQTPPFYTIDDLSRDNWLNDIKEVFTAAEDGYEDVDIYCDGIVLQVNDTDLFESLPLDGKVSTGNIALKVGVWEQNLYSGYVQEIVWSKGKSKRSPVAIVSAEEGEAVVDKSYGEGFAKIRNLDDLGVRTAGGNRVKRVPLYEPRNILKLEAYPGRVINFRYGGEAGVVPCYLDGSLLTDETVKHQLRES